LHAPKSPLLFGARDGHASPFFGLARWGWGPRRLIFGWVVLVTAHVPHAPPPPAESASASSAGTVLYFLLVFSVTVYLYNFQTLWGLFDGLDARSASLPCDRLYFIVKRGLKFIPCNVYLLFG
jgi:hypothetical protein